MRLNETDFTGVLPVDSYGPGFFRIKGRVVEGAVTVSPLGVSEWSAWDAVSVDDGIDLLVVGTGPDMMPVPEAFLDALRARNIAVEAMATPTACRAYNVLLGEGRRVGLAVLPV